MEKKVKAVGKVNLEQEAQRIAREIDIAWGYGCSCPEDKIDFKCYHADIARKILSALKQAQTQHEQELDAERSAFQKQIELWQQAKAETEQAQARPEIDLVALVQPLVASWFRRMHGPNSAMRGTGAEIHRCADELGEFMANVAASPRERGEPAKIRVHSEHTCADCGMPLVWTEAWQGWDCVVCVRRERDTQNDARERGEQAAAPQWQPLRDLVTKWYESAGWEIEQGSREYGHGLDQCADELKALLPPPPARADKE